MKQPVLLFIRGVVLMIVGAVWPISVLAESKVDDSNHVVSVCYDFNCKSSDVLTLSPKELKSIRTIFASVASNSAEERKQISAAVAQMERLVGEYTPTYRDIGTNWGDNSGDAVFPGQLDCIDESINSTTYLQLFEQNAWLKFHRVVERARRRSLFNVHWAAQIEEMQTGTKYVVDSWFEDNGHPPYIGLSKRWKDLSLF